MDFISFTRAAAGFALSIGTATAQAQGVNLTLKLMDFDLAQPTREEYRDSELGDTLINRAVEQAWSTVGGRVTDSIKTWLQAPDRLGSGMTARDVQVRLGTPGALQLVSRGQATGRLSLTVPGNEIDLTTTHPLSQGPGMDPRVRVRFDLRLTLDLHLDPVAPRLRAVEAVAQPSNVDLFALNQWASVGAALDRIKSTIGGTPALTDRLRAALESSRAPFTTAFNQGMDRSQPSLVLPGYTYNAGRIENGRVIIAQYRLKPYAVDRVAVVASWQKSLGELMGDCRPVDIGASWQAGPRPFAGVREPRRQAGKVTNVNPRTARRDEYICSTVLEVAKGAPLQVAWAQPVPIRVGSPNPMAMRQVLAAKPAGWSNPVVPTEIEYVLALTKETRPGIGVQSDAATAAQRNPIDPIAQQRRIDQVSLPQARTVVPTTSPAGSLAAARARAGTTAATTEASRLQTPQRSVIAPDSALSR